MRVLLASVLLLAAVPLAASELTVDVAFDQSRVSLDDAGPYTRVSVQGLPSYHGEGLPALPIMPVRIALPTGCRAHGIEVVDAEYTALRGSHQVMPSAAPVPLSVDAPVEPVVPDPHVYDSDVTFPASRIEFRDSGPFMGIPIATAVVHPVRWNAADGGLEVLSSMTVRVSYEPDADMMTVSRRTAESEQRARGIVEAMVVNPDGVSASGAAIVQPRELAYGEYVIVTHPDYETQAQELADWKTAKGVPANVYTTTWVDGEYSTADLQQDIRAFFHDCIDEGAEFALIYGDDSKVAGRDVIVQNSYYTEYPPVDLYFADLNDTAPGADQWDSNGNGIWGEDGDNIQWDPDLWVGRAAVTSTSEADIFNEKVFIYEGVESAMPAGADYSETAPRELRAGYTTGILWSSPYTPGKANADTISKYVPSTAWEEEFCCESGSGNSSTITFNMIDDGPHHVMHASHGSQTSMYTSSGSSYTTGQIMDQTNISSGHLPAIWNSIACLIGQMDGYECCAEAWLNSPDGGGFGAFNARYGWGNPGDAGNGPSEIVTQQFYIEHWENGTLQLGPAHATSVNYFCPPTSDVMDWCVKVYNLFGDPEISMWTAEAQDLSGDHPSEIGTGSTNVTVSVTAGGSPVSGARVCLQKGDWQSGDVYETGTTNGSGEVTLTVSATTTGNIDVTAWAHNHNPYQGTIAVTSGTFAPETGGVHVDMLGNASPSPATSMATVPYGLSQAGRARIDVYDVSGRVVRTLVDSDMSAGMHSAVWDLTDGSGSTVPAGLYHVRLQAPGFTATRSLMVLR
jgi:hypothetical protein